MRNILIVDGNSILNRAFYGIRPLTTKDGLPTNAVYGFVNIISKQLEMTGAEYAVCAFDMHAPTFRHKAYEGYKANRHGMPEELAAQLPYAKECAAALGFHVIGIEGYEADDIIGTAARFAENEPDAHAYVLTGDRDSFQLISEKVTVLYASNKDTVNFDTEKFKETHDGVDPSRFVDVKALMGDSSDNIPGVPGIGEKTALKLIAAHGSLDGVYGELDAPDIGKSVKQKLSDGKESAYLSRFLSEINRDVPLGMSFEEMRSPGQNGVALLGLFRKLEFFAFIKRFGLEESAAAKESADAPEEETVPEYERAGAEELCKKEKDLLFAVRLDGEDLYFAAEGYRIVTDAKDAAVFISDPERRFCTFDSKELYRGLKKLGTELSENCFDLQLAAYILDPAVAPFEPARICMKYLGAEAPAKDLCGAALRLYPILLEKLSADGSEGFYFRAELPLARVLADMEKRGFRIDRAGLAHFGELLRERERDLAEGIYELAGEKFNLNSPKQLGEILFVKLGLPTSVTKKNKTGYSTGAEVLEKLKYRHPVVPLIFEYRLISKLRSTYAEGLLSVADGQGIVHSSFNQTVTSTGRLSSTEPNLQNIPIKTEIGREFRRFFIPSGEGYVLIDADYSQIELRILAHMSGDEKMIEAFRSGADIHASTASEVFDVPPDEVTPILRKRAKAVNFGIVYGIGAYSLSQDIGVSVKEAEAYIKSYFGKYPKIKEYIDKTVSDAKERGWVSTLFGRKRYIPELSSPKASVRGFGERVAMNSPIQGTAADIIKIAMVDISRRLRESGLDAELILQVHDELILCAKREDAEAAAALLRDGMENVVSLSVPLIAEVSTADNWYDCK